MRIVHLNCIFTIIQMKTFVLVGDVDHGKSSTAGQLLYQVGYISPHEFKVIEEKAKEDKMESWKYARILDIWEEERVRGKTQESNSITFSYQGKEYKLIDTPGHKHFIRHMINCLFEEAIVGCLVISVREFESSFERGQTKEDLLLLRASGIEQIIILLNKMDYIEWDQKKYDEYVQQLQDYIKKLRFKKVEYVPISAYYGINLIEKGGAEWVQSSFLDLLDIFEPTLRKKGGLSSLYFDQV